VACAAVLFRFAARGSAAATIVYGLECSLALYLAARLWKRDDRTAVVLIVVTAAAIRVPALLSSPALSNDAYRYLWDGELVLRGVDPRAAAPLSPAAEPLRSTWLWTHIDYRTIPTIYPPLALALFSIAALDSQNLWGVKLVALAGDVAVVAALAAILSAMRIPRGRVALYALHPLAALEFAGNAHIEAWAIAGILIAAGSPRMRSFAQLRPLALAAAILTKIYPAVLAPIIFARERRALASVVALVAVAYLPSLIDGHVFGSSANYLGIQRFNGSIGALFGTEGELVVVAFVGLLAYRSVRRGAEIAAAVLATVLAYLASSPNVLPWYVLVLPAILCVVERPFAGRMRPLSFGIIGWSCTVALAYGAPSLWHETQPIGYAMRCIEYAPLYAGLLVWAARLRGVEQASRVAA
jgi:hypothetical protein